MGEVPVKIVRHGPTSVARRQEHHGLRLMAILERFMEFQSLKQCTMRKEIEPGVIVEASKVFGLRRIDVYVGGAAEPKKRETAECLCNCDFALGVVMELNDELLDGQFQLYNVAVCFKKAKYILREGLLTSDFTKYYEGQKVLLVPYNRAAFTCCTGVAEATGCRPIESECDQIDEDWRSTLRIIPWCGVTVPKWVKRREVR